MPARAAQLDTISVRARPYELVAYALLEAFGRNKVEQAYWGPKSETFEYWSHAACVLPRRPHALSTSRAVSSMTPLTESGSETAAAPRIGLVALLDDGPLLVRVF